MAYFRFALKLLLLLSSSVLLSCGDKPSSEKVSTKKQTIDSVSTKEFVKSFSDKGRECFSGVVNQSLTLKHSVNDFTDNVQNKTWQRAKKQWQEAEFLWAKCAIFLAVGEHYSKDIKTKQYRVSYWPIFPGYIDYVPDYSSAGLVYDTMLSINKDELIEQHQIYSYDQASVGLYVIGVLLGVTSEKKLTDYQPLKKVLNPVDDNQDITQRRLNYLRIASELWLEDLGSYVSAWMGDSNRELEYRKLSFAIINASMEALRQEQLSKSAKLKNSKLESSLFKGLLNFIASDAERAQTILKAMQNLSADQAGHYQAVVNDLRISVAPITPWGAKQKQQTFLKEMAVLRRMHQ